MVDSERYLLTCYRYIEMNPVRAAMVATPGDYRWSSYAYNAEGKPDSLVTPHPQFLALGGHDEDRRRFYRALVGESISDDDLQAIHGHVQRQRGLGSAGFQVAVEAVSGQCAAIRLRGRPRRTADP
jgi:REP-associated tyrosine transposase